MIESEKAKWVTEATVMGRRMFTVHLYQACPILQSGLWGLTCSVSATPCLFGLCLPSVQSETVLHYACNPTTWLSHWGFSVDLRCKIPQDLFLNPQPEIRRRWFPMGWTLDKWESETSKLILPFFFPRKTVLGSNFSKSLL